MKRSSVNFIVDLVAFLDLLCLSVTGFIIKFILPPGSGGRGRALHGGYGDTHIKKLLSMSRHQWGDIHLYLAVLFVVLMVVHIILHWSWIKNYLSVLTRSRGECR